MGRQTVNMGSAKLKYKITTQPLISICTVRHSTTHATVNLCEGKSTVKIIYGNGKMGTSHENGNGNGRELELTV